MKRTLLAALTALTLVTSLFYLASCGTEDLCAGVECGVHGTCNPTTGTCDCDAGYKKDTNGRCDLLIDPCTGVDCGANGTCDKGVCSCTAGYEKDAAGKCTITWGSKFDGAYICKDVCTDSKGKASTYDFEATIKSTVNTLEIGNFAGFNLTSKPINVSAANTLTIDFKDASNRVFKGTGTLVKAASATAKDVINMTYTVTFIDGTVDSCVSTYTKK